VHAEPILAAPLSPLCTPALAGRLSSPEALGRETLLRSYRADEWPRWFAAASLAAPPVRGPVFDSSALMVAAAQAGLGVALAPPAMFAQELTAGRLVRPFDIEIDVGRYWLTRLMSRPDTAAMQSFRAWMLR
jgi:LysR family transcriptional regulator of beta-lactamase